jgi:hypothetical protein
MRPVFVAIMKLNLIMGLATKKIIAWLPAGQYTLMLNNTTARYCLAKILCLYGDVE